MAKLENKQYVTDNDILYVKQGAVWKPIRIGGPQGPQGPKGERGTRGAAWHTIDSTAHDGLLGEAQNFVIPEETAHQLCPSLYLGDYILDKATGYVFFYRSLTDQKMTFRYEMQITNSIIFEWDEESSTLTLIQN